MAHTDLHSILKDVEAFAETIGVTPGTVVRSATGNPRLYDRMKRRAALIDRDTAAIQQWITERKAKIAK